MADQRPSEEAPRRYQPPYTDKRKIPTISGFREEQEHRQERAQDFEHSHLTSEDQAEGPPAERRPTAYDTLGEGAQAEQQTNAQDHAEKDDAPIHTSEADLASTDPRQRRKQKRKGRDEAAEREVTDPVTHLPVRIRDYTNDALEQAPENEPPYGTTPRTATGLSNKKKNAKQLEDERSDLAGERDAMLSLFPPPDFDAIKQELQSIHKLGATVTLVGAVAAVGLVVVVDKLLCSCLLRRGEHTGWLLSSSKFVVLAAIAVGLVSALVWGVRDWIAKRVDSVWDEEVWEANRNDESQSNLNRDTESVAWLNSLLSGVWPLVNPDLFVSVADMLEDVMQASLPKFVRMVSVDDLGQGSESLQILGVKWLPTGAAAQSVTENGDLSEGGNAYADSPKPGKNGKTKDGDQQDGDDTEKRSNADNQNVDGSQNFIAQGLEGEEGNFINLEVAFAYRARKKSKSIAERSKEAHLFLAFYLPGNIKMPVWVEIRGVVGAVRLRLQLCPDPPFFSLCTITFLGQPKVDISCVPLSKYAVNIMDVPLISNFVQSAVDAGLAEYVAPKSLNVDLKDILAGDDFKRDTAAHGVLVVNIKRGYEFKQGDFGVPVLKEGSSDPYVSVGWAKFGKPVWSTRMLLNEMEPYWDETAYILVTQQELNVDERLRCQLWDSDRMSADTDLGRIEVDLKELMTNEQSHEKMWHRCDGFRALEADSEMPGKLEWSVGYYSKARIQPCQLSKQSYDPEVRSIEQLEKKADDICANKLREANIKKGRHRRDAQELEQQKRAEIKECEDGMIMSSPPPEKYPSGIFSIQIHNITGLELGKLSKKASNSDAEASDEEEEGDGLPSAYCNIVINHKKAFKTRTKPANAKPFYNTGTERYIADWREAQVHVSVRDMRVKEDDPLLGIVHLPLAQVFKDRSQVNGYYPLVGGIGYGQIRISMVWRSIQLQAPPEALGWEYGTLEIQPSVRSEHVPGDLKSSKLRFETPISKAKLYADADGKNGWTSKGSNGSLKLAVRMRYSTCLSISFVDKSLLNNKVSAFAVLWLKDVPDEVPKTLTLSVWKGDLERATKNCLPEPGEKVGEITIELTFWPGLGRAHSKWAKKDPNVRKVVEVLGTARDNYEEMKNEEAAGIVGDTDSSDDDDDDHDDDNGDADGHKDSQDASRSSLSPGSLKQTASDLYKKHESLGRRHRGIMQWRIPRSAKWAKHKLEDGESKVTGLFRHGSRDNGIETEV